jgi:hypothetical protein
MRSFPARETVVSVLYRGSRAYVTTFELAISFKTAIEVVWYRPHSSMIYGKLAIATTYNKISTEK